MSDSRRPYPSDLSDLEWELLAPLLAPPGRCGRPRKWLVRHVAAAIFSVLRSGCAWRMLPREFPPWQTVYYHFRQWHRQGTLRRAHDHRGRIRAREGRDEQPSGAVIDSQAVKTGGVGGPKRGYDGAKRLAGRKRGCPLGGSSSIPPACCLPPTSTAQTCTIGMAGGTC